MGKSRKSQSIVDWLFHIVGLQPGKFVVPIVVTGLNPGGLLHGKTFATAAGAAGVGIFKLETFTVQPVRKIKFGTGQIQQTFAINQNSDAVVFYHVVSWLLRSVELQIVHQA